MKNILRNKKIILTVIIALSLLLCVGLISFLHGNESEDIEKPKEPFVSEIERPEDGDVQPDVTDREEELQSEKTDSIDGSGSWERKEEHQGQSEVNDKSEGDDEKVLDEEGTKQEDILSDGREWTDIR